MISLLMCSVIANYPIHILFIVSNKYRKSFSQTRVQRYYLVFTAFVENPISMTVNYCTASDFDAGNFAKIK